MEHITPIPPSDFKHAARIIEDYLPGNERFHLDTMYKKYPHLFIGYYLEHGLIGVCFGYPFQEVRPKETERLLLQGIAIAAPYHGAGRGSKLLKYFETAAAKTGDWIISLGSADGYVEGFYLKNGYIPVSLKIEINTSDCLEGYVNESHIIQETIRNDDCMGLYLQVADYDTVDKDSLTKEYKGYHSFFIFEKPVGTTTL